MISCHLEPRLRKYYQATPSEAIFEADWKQSGVGRVIITFDWFHVVIEMRHNAFANGSYTALSVDT